MSKDLLLKTRSSKASKQNEHEEKPASAHSSPKPAEHHHTPAAPKPEVKPVQAKSSAELGASFPKRNQFAGRSFGSLGKSLSGFAKFEKFAEDSKADDKTKLITPPPSRPAGPKSVRFSERYKLQGDKDNSLVKIIVFILVVIGLGLGVIYFVQSNLLNTPNNSGSQNSASTSSSEITARSEDGLLIFNKLISDSQATDIPDNEDFTEQVTSLGTKDNDRAKLTKLTYEPFETFTRVSWDLEGVEASFPRIEVKQDGDDIKVTFFKVGVSPETMLETIPLVAGNFLDVSSTSTTSQVQFTLAGQEPNSFHARLPFDGSKLVIDFKTEAQLAIISGGTSSSSASSSATSSISSSSSSRTSSASSTTTSSASSASTSSLDNSGNQLTNPASQLDQQIVNTSPTIAAKMENYSYQDFGNKFEFRWEYAGGTLKSVPNATAKMITNNGKVYIEVVMKDVTQDIFFAFGWDRASFGGLSLAYSNLKGVIFKNRTGTTSTYWVELGGKSNFQLMATETSTAGRRRLTIAVFD
jgi:hypothetical protein